MPRRSQYLKKCEIKSYEIKSLKNEILGKVRVDQHVLSGVEELVSTGSLDRDD